jgi:hypothetical protein
LRLLDKLRKQTSLLHVVGGIVFWMPLHRIGPSAVIDCQCLDVTLISASNNAKTFTEPVDGLVVVARRFENARANAKSIAVGIQVQIVNNVTVVILHVLNERAAEGNVDQLKTAADG